MFPAHPAAVTGDARQIEFRETRIERRGDQSEFHRGLAAQRMQGMQQRKAVLAAGKADQNPVARRDHFIFRHCLPGQFA